MNVQFAKNLEPLCYNLKDWSASNHPILLITGLSGSGKTTFANKIAKEYNATLISFDVLKFYSSSSKQSQNILDIFLKKYPEINKLVQSHWCKTDRKYSNDIFFDYYCNLFYDFLIEYCTKNHKKIVLEGIQLFVRLHPSKSYGMPIIIIRNSSMQSFFNKVNRDYVKAYSKIKGIKFIKYIINDTYTYHIKQKKLLNTLINYLSTMYTYPLKEAK